MHKGLFAVIFIYMKRIVKKTRWNLIIILVIFAAFTYSAVKYFTPVPQQANIFLVSQESLQLGDTTLTGTIRKDSPAGQEGKYILILDDSRPVFLDIVGIDNLINFKVVVKGYLLQKVDDLYMIVDSIEVF